MNENFKSQTILKERVKSNLNDLKKSAQIILSSNEEQKKSIESCVNIVTEVSNGSNQLANSTLNLEEISTTLKLDADLLTEQMKFFK